MKKIKLILYIAAFLLPLTLLLTALDTEVAHAASKQYTITYKNVNNADNSKNPTKYSKAVTLKNPVRKGYKFMGWYADSAYKKKVTKIASGSGNKTLYAKWTANKYHISFNGNGADSGITQSQKNCKYDKEYILSACGYTRQGYHFIGWNTKPDGSGTTYKSGSYVKNLTDTSGATVKLYAQWEIGTRATTTPIKKIYVDHNGKLCYAYVVGNNLAIISTEKGIPQKRLLLPLQHSIFGNVICDDSGYYYIVSGEDNNTENKEIDTLFITKYSPDGKVIKTVSSNGFENNTKLPFDHGNCDLALNGNQLVIFYARGMYRSPDGLNHQSDNAWMVDTESLETLRNNLVYHSHSYAQRVVPYENGFVLSALGDCFPRAFSLDFINCKLPSKELFHFWAEKDAYTNWGKNNFDPAYLAELLNTYSSMGDIIVLGDSRIALVASSAPSMDYSAKHENRGLFLQIFDPTGDLNSPSGYITSGERQGLGGENGVALHTEYGVKWLCLSETASISYVYAVNDQAGHLVILYTKHGDDVLENCYMITDTSGNILKEETLLPTALQPATPIRPCVLDGVVYFVGYDQEDKYYNILSLDIEKALTVSDEVPTIAQVEKQDFLSVYEGTRLSMCFDNAKVKSWNSSDPKIATVSKSGVISAVKNGNATITAILSDDSTYSCKVTVWEYIPDQYPKLQLPSNHVSRITIPEGVTRINYEMFENCKLLCSVKLPSTLTEIGDKAFQDCSSLKSITIPEGVKKISDRTFVNCKLLSNVTLPSTLTEIGEDAFRACSSLKSITIPESVTTIGRGAFRECTKLNSISLPPKLTTILDYTFAECTTLTTISLPDKLSRIEVAAFQGCTKLQTISFPDSLKDINFIAFKNCTSLKSLDTKNVSTIKDYTFYNCGVTTVHLPKVYYIKISSFERCSRLSELVLPDTLSRIDDYAFKDCIKLQELTLPGSLSKIGNCAFMGCKKLQELTIKSNKAYYDMEIEQYAFSGCLALKKVQLQNNAILKEGVFKDCISLERIRIPARTSSISPYLFYGCTSLTTITWPSILDRFTEEELSHYIYELPKITYDIGAYGFYGCKSLRNIGTILTNVGDYAFYGCSRLSLVNIDPRATLENPEEIGPYSFAECSNLKKVTFLSSPDAIGEYAFYNASSLMSLDSKSEDVYLTFIGAHAFAGTGIGYTFHDYGVTKLLNDNRSFIDLNHTEIVIPDSITEIEPYAFYLCEGLTGVTIPNSVTKIGAYAFQKAYFAKEVTLILPESVTYIDEHAFDRMIGGPINLLIPESVSYIGENAFYNVDKIYVKKGSYAEQWIINDLYQNCRPGNEPYIPKYIEELLEYY